MCLTLACGLACSQRENPQATFDRAYQDFVHGNLTQSQEEAHAAYQNFKGSDPEWAWKFGILEAESLLWRGMYDEAVKLASSFPSEPASRESRVKILSVEAVAFSRLHKFPEADEVLAKAAKACAAEPVPSCGDAIRADGILAVQRGQTGKAKQFFEQSLRFARTHEDRFLEATALLNLGLVSLKEEHFDEMADWTDAAYRASFKLGADDISGTAVGNLGWAYYRLGDPDRSLELTLEAERFAQRGGDVILQLSWITNAGYVYASRRNLASAQNAYLRALDLATKINGKDDVYNALRALALVCVETGELGEATKYAEQAMNLARKDKNRLNELYPLLVKGMIAARSNQTAEAERIFREVEGDPAVIASLKLRSQHALARLYEDEGHPADADREYRAALATFEAARATLHRNDSRLPFSNNAARIYDDYIHFLVARGKTDDALRWADHSRARTLTEGLGLLTGDRASAPVALDLQQITRPANGTVLFYWLGEKQSYLWVIASGKARLRTLPKGKEIEAAVERYSHALRGPQDATAAPDPDGLWLWRTLAAPARDLIRKGARVVIIPDGRLNSLNFETLLAANADDAGARPHFWIEDVTVVNASSLRLLAAGAPSMRGGHAGRSLLLIGDSVSPSAKYPELPKAAAQMESVARHFAASDRLIFAREQATPAAYLDSSLEHFSHIHFVAHGTASRLSPLDSAIVLSKRAPNGAADAESFKLYARDITRHPLRAQLVTISACYGAGERSYSGEGLVGLSWAFLRAGAHNVVAALWEATDTSTEQLMNTFYDELGKGTAPDRALRAAKLAQLKSSAFRNPFYWAPFQLYTGSGMHAAPSDLR